MSESTTPAQCRDEDWSLARDCGLMAAAAGTNAWDKALGRFSDALRLQKPSRFQARVEPWMLECFGAEIAADQQERNHRFLEEALELVQACGATASEAHQLVDYVYGRPVGDKHQEAGGVMVTLAALCLAQGLDMHAAGETELARIWTKVEQIRAKQAAKPKHSPLPEHVPPATSADDAPPQVRTLAQYHEDRGPVVWFCWDAKRNEWLGEPAWIGRPDDEEWPGYHTHWIPHPKFPAALRASKEEQA